METSGVRFQVEGGATVSLAHCVSLIVSHSSCLSLTLSHPFTLSLTVKWRTLPSSRRYVSTPQLDTHPDTHSDTNTHTRSDTLTHTQTHTDTHTVYASKLKEVLHVASDV